MKLGFHPAPWTRDGRPESFFRALDEISLSGWDGLELSGAWIVDNYGSRPAELRALLEMHDLELSASYCHLSYRLEQRAQEAELMRRVIALTVEVKGQILLIDGGGAPQPGGASEADIQRVADFANEIGALALKAGLRCAWHQHWGTIFELAAPFARLMALTDPHLLGFCPDTAQLSMGDFDLPETFRAYGPRIAYVHFKDLAPNRGQTVPATWGDTGAYHVDSRWRFVELGRGQIAFPALLGLLGQAGFKGWIVDDFDYSAYAAREASVACLRYLRHSLGLTGRRGRAGWAG